MLNRLKHRKSKALKALLVLMVLNISFCLSCGKRMPPQPPVERVSQRAQIGGIQRGDSVLISWKMPARNAPDGSVLNIDRVDVYRYAEPSSVTLSLTEEEFESQSTLISTIKLSDADFALKTQTYSDKLEFAGQAIRLIYAIRFVNDSGQKASFSNFLLVESTSKVANAPSILVAETTEPAILLTWRSPQTNIDDSTPVNIIGYNIYRKSEGSPEFKLINAAPIPSPKFADKTFEFNKEYNYFVRTVSLGIEGESVESVDTEIIRIAPKDIFPPSPPSAITIAAAPNNLSIFFATNPEKDIAGYKLYRRISGELVTTEWTLMTPELLQTNTFQDRRVETGKKYQYYLVAYDTAGNVSNSSEIVSEVAP